MANEPSIPSKNNESTKNSAAGQLLGNRQSAIANIRPASVKRFGVTLNLASGLTTL